MVFDICYIKNWNHILNLVCDFFAFGCDNFSFDFQVPRGISKSPMTSPIFAKPVFLKALAKRLP